MKTTWTILGLTLVCLLLSLPAAAQTASTGVVLGTVNDSSGAFVAGAEVTLTDVTTNRERTTTTNDDGQYTFVGVLPGIYRLRVSAKGFRVASLSGVNVEVNKSLRADVALEVGDVSETVQVTAGVGVELQTTDAQLGNVLDQRIMRNLPTTQRNATELLSLQPATTPGGFGSGGTVSGARSDQNTLLLDGIDVSDNLTGGQGVAFTQAPVGVDAISEYRVVVTNPNATFGRSAGGQITLSSPRGSNSLHGVAYWYHQNDNLNANTWSNNRTGVRKGEMKDNRAGFSLGGPIWHDKTFFWGNYEVRRFPRLTPFTRTVPTASMRTGILRFQDAAGNIVSYPLRTSTLCGAAGTSACDPRGLGLSPTVNAMFNLMPSGNDPTLGDGLNTTGFRGNVSAPFTFDTVAARFDHNITSKLQFMARYSYQRDLQPQIGQLDIRDTSNVVPLRALNRRGASVISGLDYQISPNWFNSFRFGWVQNKSDLIGTGPSAVGALLGLPGTNSSIGPTGVDLSILNEAIDVAAQSARTQILSDRNIQFSNATTWIKGKHNVRFGGEFRSLPFLFVHNDQVTFLTGPIVALDSGSFLSIPATNRPPTCAGAVTTNCIRAGDVARWNDLYAVGLGLVDNVSIVGARDGGLQPLPLGTDLISDTSMRYYQFHVEDTWRVRPSLTLTYGLTYSWLTPLQEKLDRIALITDLNTGEVFSAESYLRRKEEAARAGQVFNPRIGVRPLNDSGRDSLSDTDYSNLGPRIAVAWSPSFKDGFMGGLFGQRTVLRGGFGVVHDRVNTISVLLPAAFGIGFGQVLQTPAPLCNATGTPGAGCNPAAGAGNRALSAFRAGVDGNIPIPAFTGGTSPIVPADLSGGTSFATDPNRKIGRNYLIDFTIQREVPANMVLEVAYIGRLGRNLPRGVDLDASPYFFKDSASGQTFAQAYDAVALQLRSGVAAAAVTPQPWFDNQLPGLGANVLAGGCRPPFVAVAITNPTQCLATLQGSLFQTNSVNNLFLQMNILRGHPLGLGLPPYNNLQLLAILMATHGGVSNYHAMVATLRNRPWKGMQFDINYTLSKSLDQVGDVQNNLALISTGFDPNVDYGPAQSDRRHVINAIFNYDLPFGSGRRWASGGGALNKVVGGWYMSGIFRTFSGLPLFVVDNAGVFGGSLSGLNNGAIPLVDPGTINTGVNSGVVGSGGVGTGGNPAAGGTGLNLFANPQNVFNSFRRIELSRDGRQGRAFAFRGPWFWNFDFRLAKETNITERVKFELSFDFFNLFNNVNFATPSLSLNNPQQFGVFTSQAALPNRLDGARGIQAGMRVSF
ncbi:MAG TPA: carboxypeptidase-like regulatory domain-containing protein [Pyrinomonadaceae bacterium]|nr:carboxypeptidase-like regulatory domain-containing protein [Pyrinomonadaceae bacterium]